MTPEAQRIAIAEACGWIPQPDAVKNAVARKWFPPGLRSTLDSGKLSSIPDYLNDLNAMHEAEKVLTLEQKKIYCSAVYDIAHGYEDELEAYIGGYFEVSYDSVPAMVLATASQRAEAFLKTLNLWVPSQQEREEVRG